MNLKEVSAYIKECIQEQLIDLSIMSWISGIDDNHSGTVLLTTTEWGRNEIQAALKAGGISGVRVLSLVNDFNDPETRRIIEHGELVVKETPGWVSWSDVQKTVASHPAGSRFSLDTKDIQIRLEA